jgi:hypothetical protein
MKADEFFALLAAIYLAPHISARNGSWISLSLNVVAVVLFLTRKIGEIGA